MARIIEEEHRGKIDRFKKMIQDLPCQVTRDQEEGIKRSKIVLWSSVQVEESKEANLGNLGASKDQMNDFLLDPTADVWRIGEAFARLVDSPLAYKKGLKVQYRISSQLP
ncbi:hypothetical protein M9H77_11754 [Catharanthus roseus]|uniref:Uncharacterized protein n=1 Tax=Catharanthus roseus TaxID=4058 RepID=A0ACC0BFE9_CATRO|nr:hypothetical protein M9H77_11754 [Catharanthus roseus]